jgi:hypothetical protein
MTSTVVRALMLGAAVMTLAGTAHAQARTVRLSRAELQDKIRGGWAGQTIGVTFGGPTEFRYNGTMINDNIPIRWYDGYLKETYDKNPGLYDDLYVDLTFVDVVEKKGLDAKAQDFADALAHAGYMLWHANQMARYNVLNGIKPPASGHWLNNPEADAIDFQIESDFIGLMTPAMPRTAAAFADTVGHIMNYGDGWYGGVFISTMYSLAFTTNDVNRVVRGALEAIPAPSTFHQTIADVIRWHDQYPNDWKRTWFEIQKKWSDDVGTARAVFDPFDIDAKLNSAYVVLGLLYGQGDFGRTVSIATRAGQDSDCNPSSAAGILGTMLGHEKIPTYWKQGLAQVEPIDFKYTTISLNDAYALSYKHALENVRRNGGTVTDAGVEIPLQPVRPVRLEQSFVGHHPAEKRSLRADLADEYAFDFDGIGFAINANVRAEDQRDHVPKVEVHVDGKLVETVALPTNQTARRFVAFWRYQLPKGTHHVRLKLANPGDGGIVTLDYAILYSDAPSRPQY